MYQPASGICHCVYLLESHSPMARPLISVKGQGERKAGGENKGEKITDTSDGLQHCQGLEERPRPAQVGGEGFHSPVDVLCHTGVCAPVVPAWEVGWRAGSSVRSTTHRCLCLPSLAGLSLRSPITTVRWSSCEAISFPQTKRPAQPQKSCSLD